MFKLSVVVFISLIVSLVTSAPTNNKKREIIVDRNGFYLGQGSNNNIREASQLFDITGPLANPWINPYTHVLNRPSAVLPVGAGGFPGGVAPPVASVPAPPAPVFQQQQQPVFQQQQQQQSYNYQYQQPAPQPQPQPQPQVSAQQYYYQQPQQQVVSPQPQPQPQAPVQQYYYQQPQQQVVAPQPQPQQVPQPVVQQQSYYYQQPPQPAPQPQPEPVQQPQQSSSYSYGAQDQQSVPQFQDQSQFSSQMSQIPQLMSPSKDGKLQSFTAVFRPGQPVELKMGLPSDFQSGQYVKFNVN